MTELERCPFCGGIAVTTVRVAEMGCGEDRIDFTVLCSDCRTSKTVRLILKEERTFSDVEKAMEEAVSLWNRRAK